MAPPFAAQGDIHALRETIARIEGSVPKPRPGAADGRDTDFSPTGDARLPLGIDVFDAAMGGGFPAAGLAEIRTAQTRDWGTASAFVMTLIACLAARVKALSGPLVWIGAPEARLDGGDVWMPGFAGLLGPVPRIVLVRPARLGDALWAAETAAASASIGAAILEVRGNPAGFALAESRRLHLRARASARPLFLLRQAGAEEASAAPVRFHVAPAPAAARPLAGGAPLPGSLGRPAFAVTLEKSRLPASPSLTLEWNPDESRFAVRFPVAGAGSAGPAHPGAQLPASSDRPDLADAARTVLAFARAS